MSSLIFTLTASILSSVRENNALRTDQLRKVGVVMNVLRMSMIWHFILQLSVWSCCSNGFIILSSRMSLLILVARKSKLLITPSDISLLVSFINPKIIGKSHSFIISPETLPQRLTIFLESSTFTQSTESDESFLMQGSNFDFCYSSLIVLVRADRVLQEAALSSGQLEVINFINEPSKISLKWGFVHLLTIRSMYSHNLILILHELQIDKFLNLVRDELGLTS